MSKRIGLFRHKTSRVRLETDVYRRETVRGAQYYYEWSGRACVVTEAELREDWQRVWGWEEFNAGIRGFLEPAQIQMEIDL